MIIEMADILLKAGTLAVLILGITYSAIQIPKYIFEREPIVRIDYENYGNWKYGAINIFVKRHYIKDPLFLIAFIDARAEGPARLLRFSNSPEKHSAGKFNLARGTLIEEDTLRIDISETSLFQEFSWSGLNNRDNVYILLVFEYLIPGIIGSKKRVLQRYFTLHPMDEWPMRLSEKLEKAHFSASRLVVNEIGYLNKREKRRLVRLLCAEFRLTKKRSYELLNESE